MKPLRGRFRVPWLVLTPEEKKTLAFVVAAFLIGVVTKQLREADVEKAPEVALNTPPSAVIAER